MDNRLLTTLHAHGKYCDGRGELEQFVQTAIERNFRGLGFSSHAPIPVHSDWTMPEKELPLYLDEIETLKQRYKGQIDLYTGLEIDYVKGLISPADARFQKLKLDFSIGSIHSLYDPQTGKHYCVYGPEEEVEHLINATFRGSSKKMIHAYYEASRELLAAGGFSFLGHLDLIKKLNKNSRYFDEASGWYREEIEHTLAVAREHNRMLEVNTGGIARGYITEPYPSPWIIELCGNMGIPLVLNSDAHRHEDIDFHYAETAAIIKKAGCRRLSVLSKNGWEEVLL